MTPDELADDLMLEKDDPTHMSGAELNEAAAALRRLAALERVLARDLYLTISRADEGWTVSAFPYQPGETHETAIHPTPLAALLALAEKLEVGDA